MDLTEIIWECVGRNELAQDREKVVRSCERVKEYSGYLTLRRLMSYIYGAPILDVSRSHTTTQHSR